MEFNIGKTICKNGKNYIITSVDDENIRLQVLTKNNTTSRGRPIDLRRINFNLWLNDTKGKGQFNGKVNFNFDNKHYMVTSFCRVSERLTLRNVVDGKTRRGRPRVIYLTDLPESYQHKLLSQMNIPASEIRF